MVTIDILDIKKQSDTAGIGCCVFLGRLKKAMRQQLLCLSRTAIHHHLLSHEATNYIVVVMIGLLADCVSYTNFTGQLKLTPGANHPYCDVG